MQIISGKFRGRKLALPPNARPTQNRARVALFNMIGPMIENHAAVWDAFAGSGAFGIEFLSRGWAKRAIFTDADAGAINAVRKNLAGFDAGQFTLLRADALSAVKEFATQADIVFVDPPFASPELGEKFIAEFSRHAKPGAIIIWEMENTAHSQNPTAFSGVEVLKDKTYGRARFLIMKKI